MSVTLQDIKLQTIDFDWIRQTTKISHLKRAIALIEQDGNYYTQLKQACYARMSQIDPTIQKLPSNHHAAPQLQQNIQQELNQWEAALNPKNISKTNETNLEDIEKYFDNETTGQEQSRKKERAEKERMKGNEAIKSKDYDQAITYYSKSIELDTQNHIAFSNRALAYLKKRNFHKCLEDCEQALALDSTYSKAYHRKAKALIELKRKIEAYRCYKEIIKLEPDNNEVNKEMMDLRAEMTEAEISELDSNLIPKNEFKKITIEEDSDQEIEQK